MNVNYLCKNIETFKQIIINNKIVVVKLGAKWCNPCKIIAPKYDEMAKNVDDNLRKFYFKGVQNLPSCSFLSIDVDDICEDTGDKWGDYLQCNGVPMFLIFFNKKIEETFMGGDLKPVSDCIERIIQLSFNTTSV